MHEVAAHNFVFLGLLLHQIFSSSQRPLNDRQLPFDYFLHSFAPVLHDSHVFLGAQFIQRGFFICFVHGFLDEVVFTPDYIEQSELAISNIIFDFVAYLVSGVTALMQSLFVNADYLPFDVVFADQLDLVLV